MATPSTTDAHSAAAGGLRQRYRDLRVQVPDVQLPADPLALSPVRSDDEADDGDDEAARQERALACAEGGITHWSTRGVFLLTMAFAVFAAFVGFILIEMTRHHPTILVPHTWRSTVHTLTLGVFMGAIPLTNLAAWIPVAVTQLPATDDASPVQKAAAASACPVARTMWQRIVLRFRVHRNFAIYQAVAWALYGFIVFALVACPTENVKLCEFGYQSNLAVAAFISEVLVISSILSLEERRDRNREPRVERFVVLLNNYINMLLVIGAMILAIGSEYTKEYSGESGIYSLGTGIGSLTLFITALLNTYGLGGLLSTKDGWKFYQPFTGGAKFMFFQAVSWTCVGVGIFIQGLYLLSIVIVEIELFVGAMVLAGSLFVLAEVLMMVSLLVFKREPEVTDTESPRDRPSFQQRLSAFAEDMLGAMLVGVLANLQWVPCAFFYLLYGILTNLSLRNVVLYGTLSTLVQVCMAVSLGMTTHWYLHDSSYGQKKHVSKWGPKYVLPPLMFAVMPGTATLYHFIHGMDATPVLFLASLYFYVYITTYRGQPQHTGARMRDSWVNGKSRIIDTVANYFEGKIIRDVPLDPNQHYIFSFHPHGIMTISALWLQFTDQWRALFPGIQPHILCASIVHQIPLVRDVIQFYGAREVTRQAFSATLEEKESVLLVPGGQAEMLYQRSGQRETRVYTGHKGFIRLAIEYGVPLVPVVSFREGEMMDNVNMPMMQKWFVKKMAVPFPYLPYGRAYLPIPRKVQMTIAIGAPLHVEKKVKPTAEDVDKVHKQYFAAVAHLFDKYKADAGCEDYKLVLI
ncbi:TPA: hypothetical protein N0F65_011341 [Lagenidium giganteum]|uniref:Diacylglycerol O-acyltransferase n=1 Tax=Lagenidium giganteum TaxID=4803 RepID=A0AAV2Z760_9STRA|nr:TPA: hypothetical protein N0F65_011341 [Lagenidium giganteum]